MTPAPFDLADAQLLDDPYAVYRRLRDEQPLLRARIGGSDVWLVSRYDDVKSVLEHPTSLMRPPGVRVPPLYGDGPAARMWQSALSMMDPPDHTRVRKLIAGAFTRRRSEARRENIQARVAQVFDRLADRSQIEVVTDLSLQVPMGVICELLGIPETDWAQLQAWTPDFLRIFLPEANSPQDLHRLNAASGHFLDYFTSMVASRRRAPRQDLTTALVEVSGPEGLSDDELVGVLRGLLTAGFETSAATISAIVWNLANHPEQLRQVREQPQLIPGAVAEILRWETPVQAHCRYLGEPRELHSQQLPVGSAVWVLMGAANRDPRRFQDPDRVDLTRLDAGQLAFGAGRHFCVGAYLSRIELEEVLRQIALRWQAIEPAGDMLRRRHFQFRCIERLPVRIRQN